MLPSDSIQPSAFAVGTPRKVAKNTRTRRAGVAAGATPSALLYFGGLVNGLYRWRPLLLAGLVLAPCTAGSLLSGGHRRKV